MQAKPAVKRLKSEKSNISAAELGNVRVGLLFLVVGER